MRSKKYLLLLESIRSQCGPSMIRPDPRVFRLHVLRLRRHVLLPTLPDTQNSSRRDPPGHASRRKHLVMMICILIQGIVIHLFSFRLAVIQKHAARILLLPRAVSPCVPPAEQITPAASRSGLLLLAVYRHIDCR